MSMNSQNGSRPHVVTLEGFLPFVEEMLDREFTVHRIWRASDPRSAIAAVGEQARAIAAFGHNPIGTQLLDQLPNVRIVSLMSVGYDRIDLPALRAHSVQLTNTPDVLTDDVADL